MRKKNTYSKLPKHFPNPDLWNKINQRLDVEEYSSAINNMPSYHAKNDAWANIENVLNRKSAILSLYKYAAVAAVILIVFSIKLISDSKTNSISIAYNKEIYKNFESKSILKDIYTKPVYSTDFISKPLNDLADNKLIKKSENNIPHENSTTIIINETIEIADNSTQIDSNLFVSNETQIIDTLSIFEDHSITLINRDSLDNFIVHNNLHNTIQENYADFMINKNELTLDNEFIENENELAAEITDNLSNKEILENNFLQKSNFMAFDGSINNSKALMSSNSGSLFNQLKNIVNSNIKGVSIKKKQKTPYKKLNGFYAGPTVNYNSTSILNQNTYGAYRDFELKYEYDFGTAYGVALGYNFKNKFGIQIGCIFNSKQGQKYGDVIDLKYVTREVNLNYTHIPLLFKFKKQIGGFDKNPVMLNFNIGGQYGHLKSAEIVMNKTESFRAEERFKKQEFGLILGLESDIFITDNVFITIGTNASISSNINEKGWEAKDDYGKSHNMLFGLNLGLNYYLKKF